MDPAIERLQRRCASDSSAVSLAGGLPFPALFPRDALADAAARVLREEGDRALQYDWPEGRPRMRAWIAARLRDRGANVTADDVIVTSGAQQAVSIAVAIVRERGVRIGVDDETYPGALGIFASHGAEASAHEAATGGAYVMPGIANPRGLGMSSRDRESLLARSERNTLFIIEDDAYASLRFDGAVPPPLLARAPERVFHVGTFSKSLCPGLRVGWLVAPRAVRSRALELKRSIDVQANGLAQAIVEDFLARHDFDAHLAAARARYVEHADALCTALRRVLPSWRFDSPEGGFSIWAATPERGDDASLLEDAVREGVSFDPGRMFTAVVPPPTLSLRLCFSLEPPSRIDEGVRRLARAWDAWLARGRA